MKYVILSTLLVISLLITPLSSAVEQNELPVTVYDRVWKKNIPVNRLSEERLQELLQYQYKPTKWSSLSLQLKEMKTEENILPDVAEDFSMTKEEIAKEFGIKAIYDPALKRNRQISSISRQRLISYLNHPVTQKITFPNKQKWVDQKLEELGLKEEDDHAVRAEYTPQRMYKGQPQIITLDEPEERIKVMGYYIRSKRARMVSEGKTQTTTLTKTGEGKLGPKTKREREKVS